MLELLMPAGNLKKLKTAFHFGADAVYIGGKAFSLRAFADNFSNEEIIEAANYAHALGKKVYVTANIFARNDDLDALKNYFVFLLSAGRGPCCALQRSCSETHGSPLYTSQHYKFACRQVLAKHGRKTSCACKRVGT